MWSYVVVYGVPGRDEFFLFRRAGERSSLKPKMVMAEDCGAWESGCIARRQCEAHGR